MSGFGGLAMRLDLAGRTYLGNQSLHSPRTIIERRRGGRAVVHEIARAQGLRRARVVGVEQDLDNHPGDYLDHPDANLAAVRGGEECEGKHVGRASYRETGPGIGRK